MLGVKFFQWKDSLKLKSHEVIAEHCAENYLINFFRNRIDEMLL